MQTKTNPWMISTMLLVGLVIGFQAGQISAASQAAETPSRPAPERVLPAQLPEKPELPEEPQLPRDILLAAVTARDHLRGAKNAKVTLVEFSDTECPFCRKFHPTLRQILKKFPDEVRWVYRHYPLDGLHAKSRKEAEATECAAELGGNEKFWAYLDRLFEVTPGNDGLDSAELPNIAEYVGLSKASFESCLSSGRHAKRVADDLADATLASGGEGTPHTVVIGPDGKKFAIGGAQPYVRVEQMITELLK